jgi:MFS family permease
VRKDSTVTDPVTSQPEELREPLPPAGGAVALLGRRDFRRLYFAVCASELGDSLHYIALMWFALVAGGPLGVVAVRLADSVPALLFGFHGGVAADRFDRRRLLVASDLVRAVVLVPMAVAGLAGSLPLWVLVVAAFLLATATSYFAPAYGALLPALVGRENAQRANGLVRASVDALSIGGWAAAAGLLSFLPLSVFFAVNAVSFVVSAALITTLRTAAAAPGAATKSARVGEGFAALRRRPELAAAVAAVAVAVTITSGTWIAGVPEFVHTTLGRGAGTFSIVMVGYALGSIGAGILLARVPVRRKARVSMLMWVLYLPAYGAFAVGGSLAAALAGAAVAGFAQGSALVLTNAAVQEEVPDALLGRVSGLVSLAHRGAHATGLLLVSPFFAIVAPRSVFAAAAVALPVVGLAAAAIGARAMARRDVTLARSHP